MTGTREVESREVRASEICSEVLSGLPCTRDGILYTPARHRQYCFEYNEGRILDYVLLNPDHGEGRGVCAVGGGAGATVATTDRCWF